MTGSDREGFMASPCPHCGVLTVGRHIAGTVYDFQCDDCCDQIDAGFRSFIDAVINEVSDSPSPSEEGRS
jgi:hypothetical protein